MGRDALLSLSFIFWGVIMINGERDDKEIAEALGKVLKGYGYELLENPQRLKGFLADLLPDLKKETRLLLGALREDVGKELYNSRMKRGTVEESVIRKCQHRLVDNMFLSDEASERVVSWIVSALNVKEGLTLPEYYREDYQPVIKVPAERKKTPQTSFLGIITNNAKETAYSEDGKTLLSYGGKENEFFLEDHVEAIGDRCFAGASHLKSVMLTGNIKTIGKYAFKDCTGIESICLPRGVEKVGGAAFRGCTSLSNIIIARGLAKIDIELFKGCTSLAHINIPDTVEEIGDRAFMDCEKLDKVIIKKNIKYIGRDAFKNCAPDFFIEVLNNAYAIQYCLQNGLKYTRRV
ncbi:MAG: leucine-rich repeat domain-containing protein [Selenomonadaceae bacterium]|nr:leucine-rich repeat domain-containing protein [Selenomonadaceae bacterium]